MALFNRSAKCACSRCSSAMFRCEEFSFLAGPVRDQGRRWLRPQPIPEALCHILASARPPALRRSAVASVKMSSCLVLPVRCLTPARSWCATRPEPHVAPGCPGRGLSARSPAEPELHHESAVTSFSQCPSNFAAPSSTEVALGNTQSFEFSGNIPAIPVLNTA